MSRVSPLCRDLACKVCLNFACEAEKKEEKPAEYTLNSRFEEKGVGYRCHLREGAVTPELQESVHALEEHGITQSTSFQLFRCTEGRVSLYQTAPGSRTM